jgi:hypothetical protein
MKYKLPHLPGIEIEEDDLAFVIVFLLLIVVVLSAVAYFI